MRILTMSDTSNMSEEFHDWLEQCPCHWFKKYGEPIYTFIEDDEENEIEESDKEKNYE